jgi:hypothetical protein
MRQIVAALLLSPSAALACTMLVTRPNLGLPGEPAGPDSVFTSANPDSVLLGPGDIEVAVTRAPHAVEGRVGEVLTPVEPLAPGDYRIEPCDAGAACTATISEGAGDPGEPPAPPSSRSTRLGWAPASGPTAGRSSRPRRSPPRATRSW